MPVELVWVGGVLIAAIATLIGALFSGEKSSLPRNFE